MEWLDVLLQNGVCRIWRGGTLTDGSNFWQWPDHHSKLSFGYWRRIRVIQSSIEKVIMLLSSRAPVLFLGIPKILSFCLSVIALVASVCLLNRAIGFFKMFAQSFCEIAKIIRLVFKKTKQLKKLPYKLRVMLQIRLLYINSLLTTTDRLHCCTVLFY